MQSIGWCTEGLAWALWLKIFSCIHIQYSAFALRCFRNVIAILKYFFFVECHFFVFKM
jgi:hypothetical protein